MQEFISKSAEETEQFGFDFASKINPGDVVFLIGNLGSGKTTFVKGFARGLGIESRVISPTFIVVRTHAIDEGNIKTLYHLDLYRLSSSNDTKSIDLQDMLQDENGVVVIEWPEIGQNLVHKKVWKLSFAVIDEDSRKITTQYE